VRPRVGAFSTTDLGDQLCERGVDTLILAGVSTSGCVLSTVRDASDCDYRLIVVADACFDRNPEAHAALIECIFPRQAEVLNVAELEARLS
jgi:nicotinamidase-related amidase